MGDIKLELKPGIKAHLIKTELFKTNLISIIITTPLKRKTITKNALIPFLLKRGSKKYPTHEDIALRLEELYGADMIFGIDKVGDNHVLKITAQSINNDYTLNGEDLIKDLIEFLIEVTFNPYMENGKFKETALDTEKLHLKELIDGKKNSKDLYAYSKCLENMYEFKGYGLYRFGYSEDIEKITLEEISDYYRELISTAKIDIFISGKFNENDIKNILENNEILKTLEARKPNFIVAKPPTEIERNIDNPKVIKEKMDINQGKLVMGYNILDKQENSRNIGILTNSILGESANSLLFQNVREKAGLAYSVRSSFINTQNILTIHAGINPSNYDKAIEIIKNEVEKMKNGDFSDKDIENSRICIIAGIKNIEVEQDTEIIFYLGQELSQNYYSVNDYIESVKSITKEQIIEFSKSFKLNTIYFLSNLEK